MQSNLKLKFLPPNINKSQMNFSINNEAILFGLSAIKGIGENFATEILNNRNCNFASMQDFIDRVNPKKTQIISLINLEQYPVRIKRRR